MHVLRAVGKRIAVVVARERQHARYLRVILIPAETHILASVKRIRLLTVNLKACLKTEIGGVGLRHGRYGKVRRQRRDGRGRRRQRGHTRVRVLAVFWGSRSVNGSFSPPCSRCIISSAAAAIASTITKNSRNRPNEWCGGAWSDAFCELFSCWSFPPWPGIIFARAKTRRASRQGLFVILYQRLRAQLFHAPRAKRAVHALNLPEHFERKSPLICLVKRDAHVLQIMLDIEARRIIARYHLGAVGAQLEAGRRTAADALKHRFGRKPHGLRVGKRSETPAIVPAIAIWLAILVCWPAPGPPASVIVLPIRSNSGRQAANASSVPPAIMESVAFFAPASPPDTARLCWKRRAPSPPQKCAPPGGGCLSSYR